MLKSYSAFFCLFLYLSCGFCSPYKIDERVLICGVCKNVSKTLNTTIHIVENIGNLFDDYKVIVYENNSNDETLELLYDWEELNPKVKVITEFLKSEDFEKSMINRCEYGKFFIPEQIARARNKVLDEALKAKYDIYTYVIWIDLDFSKEPNYQGFIETFSSTTPWDAVFAYGISKDGAYFDWFAHRDNGSPIGSELLGDLWWKKIPRKIRGKMSPSWIPVTSAFGGCGIYKKEAIKNCRYSATVTQDLEWIVKKQLLNNKENDLFKEYLFLNKSLEKVHLLNDKKPHLKEIKNKRDGVVIHEWSDPIIWRMSCSCFQYPVVCEHVTFHASMIKAGFDKLYINPSLIFQYDRN